MRMRKKKNLIPRMNACAEFLAADPASLRGKWLESKSKTGRLLLEIGCGKGQFACTMARRNPDDLLVAVEKSDNVLLLALERAKEMELTNILFIGTDAARLADVFAPNEVSGIFLNFSDPWPASNRAKRRLTHPNFLSVYDAVLPPSGEICMKTDNVALFEFSLCQLSQFGYHLLDVSLNLHARGDESNIKTEYEQRFSAMGMPIHMVRAQKPQAEE